MDYNKVSEIVLNAREEFIKNGCRDYEQINYGSCFLFFDHIYFEILQSIEPNDPIIHSILKFDTNLFTSPDNKLRKGEIYYNLNGMTMKLDIETLCMPPYLYNTISYDELINMNVFLGLHCFLYFDGLFYDSETPYGVKYIFEIPFFKRIIEKYILIKYRPNKELTVKDNRSETKFFIDNQEISSHDAQAFIGTYINYYTCDNNWNILDSKKVILSDIRKSFNRYVINYLGSDELIANYKLGLLSPFSSEFDDIYFDEIGFFLGSITFSYLGECDIVLLYPENTINDKPTFIIYQKKNHLRVCSIYLLKAKYSIIYGKELNKIELLELDTFLNSENIYDKDSGNTIWKYACYIWNWFFQEADDNDKRLINLQKNKKPIYTTINNISEIKK